MNNTPVLELPKLILSDIDGVWTDGGMYYGAQGGEIKKFNTSDSAGVLFAKKLGIPVGIITGEDTPMVAQRAKKLKIELVFQGVSDKASVVEELLQRFQVSWNEVAYIGDDIGDWKVLKQVGFSGAPCNAPKYIQQSVDYITTKAGGEGAFREFVEWLIDRSIGLEGVLADFS